MNIILRTGGGMICINIKDEIEQSKQKLSHIIKWYFRSFTYAADCNRLLDVKVKPHRSQQQTTFVKPIDIEIIIYKPEDLGQLPTCLAEYFRLSETNSLKVVFPNKQWDFEEQVNFLNDQPRRFRRKAPEVEKFSLLTDEWKDRRQGLKDKIYIRKLLPNHSELDFNNRYAEFISLLKRRTRDDDPEREYGSLFDKIQGIYLVIGRTTHFERFGMTNRGERLIAANGIPTSHEITIRSTNSTWYVETIHFIINVDERLNYGKKQIANTRLIGKVRDYFDDAYAKLMEVSKTFVRVPDPRRVEDDEITTDFIDLLDLALPDINLVKEPVDENSLIFLFAQLLNYHPVLQALGIEQIELQLYGLQSKGIYDGKFRWNPDTRPLADDHLNNLEFKLSLNDLTEEFDSHHSAKEFRNTDLIVVWRDDVPQDSTNWKVRGVDEQRRRELDRKGVPGYIEDVLEEDQTAEHVPLIILEYWVEQAKEVLAASKS